jgi:hypothetical protein
MTIKLGYCIHCGQGNITRINTAKDGTMTHYSIAKQGECGPLIIDDVEIPEPNWKARTPPQKQGLRGVGMSLLHGKALLDYKLPSGRGEAASREAFVSGWLEAVGQSFKDRQDAIDSAHRAFRKYAEGVNAPPPRSPSAPVAP